MTPACAILDRIRAAGLTIRPDPERPDGVKGGPPERLTPELKAVIVANKQAILAALPHLAPVRSPPGSCAYCGRQGQAGSDLMAYFSGLAAHASCHVWLHPGECATAWHLIWRAADRRH